MTERPCPITLHEALALATKTITGDEAWKWGYDIDGDTALYGENDVYSVLVDQSQISVFDGEGRSWSWTLKYQGQIAGD